MALHMTNCTNWDVSVSGIVQYVRLIAAYYPYGHAMGEQGGVLDAVMRHDHTLVLGVQAA